MSDHETGIAEIRRIAVGLLARREHSTGELRRKLIARDYAGPLVDEVLAGLRGRNLLSDRRFAEEYAASRMRRGYGPLRIRSELKERGVGDELVDEIVDSGAGVWRERIEVVREKRFGSGLPADIRERSRQSRFLQYRGFTSEQIRAVFRQDAGD